jgi:predicted Holliday junction resolvase-like endonuclease
MENSTVTVIVLCGIVTVLSILVSYYLYKLGKRALIDAEADFSKKLASQKKRSGAVRWGKTIEHFAPFTSEFPIPVEDVVFLGMPIDFIGFTKTAKPDECRVHFIEVKSNSAFLSKKQEAIKEAIKQGRVDWHEVTLEGNTVL